MATGIRPNSVTFGKVGSDMWVVKTSWMMSEAAGQRVVRSFVEQSQSHDLVLKRWTIRGLSTAPTRMTALS